MTLRPLEALPGLLAGEPVIAELLGVDDAVVAVPESARSVVLAAVAALSTSPTVLVATATAREAEQLVHDLVPFLGADAVELLPPGRPSRSNGCHRRPRPWAVGSARCGACATAWQGTWCRL